jgi:phosphatidylethanolamine-binding protein (PEBP) family uncharacterized protein
MTYVHWVLYNISKETVELARDAQGFRVQITHRGFQ